MPRVTSPKSPYTFLQQRLQYISRYPEQSWLVFVENVPQWSPSSLAELAPAGSLITGYGPCNGYDDLLASIRDRENNMYCLGLMNDRILVTNGALHGLSLLFRVLHRPGATALCQAPVLGSIADMVANNGYRTVFFSTDAGELDIQTLSRQCTDDVCLIYINTPHNPTGD